MKTRAGAIPLLDFTGGEASCFPVSRMPAKYSMLMQNCFLSERGNIAKIPGYAKINATSTGNSLQNGFEFKKTDGTTQILAAGGGNVYKLSAGEFTAIKTGLDSSAKVYFSTMNNLCIITNGITGQQYKYDGTTVTALGGTPPDTTFKTHVHKGRVWTLQRANKMLAVHSALNNPEDFTGSGSGYIDFKYILTDGDELVDIFSYVDLLVFVFKNHIAIYSGTTPSGTGADFQLVQLIKGAGAVTTGVVLNFGTDAAFVDRTGIKSLRQVVTTGSMNLNDLSKNIDPTLQAEINAGGSYYAAAHYPKLGWGVFLLHNIAWIYSYTWKAWYRIVGADINGMFTGSDGKLYLCGSGYLYQYDTGYSFNGAAINMEWQTAWIALSKIGAYAYPKLLEIMYYPSATFMMEFSIHYDFTNLQYEGMASIASLGTTAFDDVTDIDAYTPFDAILDMSYRLPLFGRGRVAKLGFKNSSTTGPIEISNLTLWLK